MEKALRKECNTQGIVLFVYKMIMSTAVTVAMLVGILGHLLSNMGASIDDLLVYLPDIVMEVSGWGYLLAIAVGLAVLFLWKKPTYIRNEIFKKGRPMGIGSFITILCVFMAAQMVSQIGLNIMDSILGVFGKSMSAYLESASVDTSAISMWLYAGLGAPIFEEILFRGLLMRSLEPYGKRISIVVSALLFGFYHGNPVQTPYAALVGLVLGYVAMEYNIIWAMVLHMFNNLIFADCFARVLQDLPLDAQNTIVYAVMVAFALAAVILLIVKRKRVMEEFKKEKILAWQYNAAFLSPMMLIVYASCIGDMALFMLMVLFA